MQQRRLMQAAFHHQRIAKYGDVMVSYARTAIADWKDGETRDIHSEMTALAQAIVGKTLFNIDFTDHAHCIGSALLVAMAATSNRRNRFSKLRERVRTRRGMGEAIQHLDHIVYDIIAARSRSSEKRDDLLGILLSAQNNEVGGRLLSDRQVRDELLTLSLAGQETSAVLLSCIWYLLAQHPQVQVRLETELDACLAGRAPTAADLPRLPYTEMVVKEAMRLYPPAHAVFRSVAEPCTIAGYPIEPETMLILPQWVTHRDSRWFGDADVFRPDRWTTDGAKPLPRYAYFPFGGGQRQCLGKGFATTMAVLLLATIGQQFRFSLLPGELVTPLLCGREGATRGVRMVVARRKKSY